MMVNNGGNVPLQFILEVLIPMFNVSIVEFLLKPEFSSLHLRVIQYSDINSRDFAGYFSFSIKL